MTAPTRAAIIAFVERVTSEGRPDYVPAPERVGVFDNDGTLWCEKPMPIQLDFTLRRFAQMAEADPALRVQQPWKACYERDLAWLGAAMVKHYHGDDGDLLLLMNAVPKAFAGDERGRLRRRDPGLLRDGGPSDARAALPDMRATSRWSKACPWNPRGAPVRHLHRLGRRP